MARPEQMVLHVQTPRLRSCPCFARWLRLSLVPTHDRAKTKELGRGKDERRCTSTFRLPCALNKRGSLASTQRPWQHKPDREEHLAVKDEDGD